MLWYKTWLETRWRFIIGLAVLFVSATSTVLVYSRVVEMLPLVPKLDLGGELGRRVAEAIDLVRTYRGYIWSQWFLQNLPKSWALFAALLGTGGLLAQSSGGGALYTLSLPTTRTRLLGIRATTGLAELFVMAFLPSLLVPILSLAVGRTYSVADTLIHSACLFIAGSVIFTFTLLLSTVFSDVWRPPLIVLCAAALLGLFEQVVRGMSRYSLFGIMSGEAYYRSGSVPWIGLLASAALSALLFHAATRNLARRDF